MTHAGHRRVVPAVDGPEHGPQVVTDADRGNASDSTTVAGGFTPTGSVTFQLYGPGDTTCATPIATCAGTLAGGTTAARPGRRRGHVRLGRHLQRRRQQLRGLAVRQRTVVVTPQVLTGRASGLSAQASLLGLALVNLHSTPDTGPVSTTATTSTSVPCVATLGGLVSGHLLCAQVATTAFPGRSVATASLDDTTERPRPCEDGGRRRIVRERHR